MELRSILLILSCIIVGLCLSLYFQTGQEVQTINWDQYRNLHYNEERSQSLADLNRKIAPYNLQEVIAEIHAKNRLAGRKTRVMEIGPGNGRVLMELKKLLPNVEFYGINKEKTRTFYRRESFILTALNFELFSRAELNEMELPYLLFLDLDFGAKIPYKDNRFDVIFSQDTISEIKYKFELFNEIMRILKPGGVSFHTDLSGVNLYSKGVVLDFKDALAELRRRDVDIKTLENQNSIRFKKPDYNQVFPVQPHQPIPTNLNNIPKELRRPEMGYNITQ